ncbi:MAG TPA: hypothetical protein VFN88_05180 [Caulobacteraceae bacterium]|nr:hypothetical protein [Caulobacteraceae bacterium]
MSIGTKTYKQSNKPLLIALAVSAVIAMALAFYLTTTGHAQKETAEAAPAVTVADAGR